MPNRLLFIALWLSLFVAGCAKTQTMASVAAPTTVGNGEGFQGGDLLRSYLDSIRLSIFAKLRALKRSPDLTICGPEVAPTADPVLSAIVKNMTPAQRAYCRDFILRTLVELPSYYDVAGKASLVLSYSPIEVELNGKNVQVAAKTTPEFESDIIVDANLIASYSRDKIAATLLHEFIHKLFHAPFGGKITDAGALGPFTGGEGGANAIDAFAAATVIYAASGRPGSLDTSGNGGISVLEFTTEGATATSVQPDGKVILAGWTLSGGHRAALVARYLADGNLDSTFGPNHTGVTILPVPERNCTIKALAIQGDGAILVGGEAVGPAFATLPQHTAFLFRLHPNGALDTGYSLKMTGTGMLAHSVSGIQLIDLGAERASVSGMALLPTDDAIVAVNYRYLGRWYGAVMQFLPTGQIDASFGTHALHGFTKLDLAPTGGEGTFIEDVLLLPDRTILLTGAAGAVFITRLSAVGAFDSTFGLEGSGFRKFGMAEERGKRLVAIEGGKFLLAYQGAASVSIARFHPEGALDQAFADDGIREIFFPPQEIASVVDIHREEDGRVILVGSVSASQGGMRPFLARFLRGEAEFDETFGEAGISFPDTLSATTVIASIASDRDKIFLVGSVGSTDDLHAILLRINNH